MKLVTYQPSTEASRLTWPQWRKLGGCGISALARNEVVRSLGPEAGWASKTLGDLAQASVLAGREIARFAVEVLGKPQMAVQEVR